MSAKSRVSLPDPDAVRALIKEGGQLSVRVTPGARSESIEIADARLLVKVRAKPEDGKATTAVMALVAQALDIAPSRVTLLRGATSREKMLKIDG